MSFPIQKITYRSLDRFPRGIKPENLPPEEDLKKLERRIKTEEKKLIVDSGKLPRS